MNKKVFSILKVFAFCSLFITMDAFAITKTVENYELEGYLSTTNLGQWSFRGGLNTFVSQNVTMDIKRGDLLMSVNYETGVTTITGKTTVCIVDCGSFRYPTSTPTGVWVRGSAVTKIGAVDLAWDVQIKNPKTGSILGDGSIQYDMQSLGNLTSKVAGNVPLVLKSNPDLGYAFSMNQIGNSNVFNIDTWLMFTNSIIGSNFRIEAKEGEAVFNTNLLAYRLGGSTPPPSNPVPEPTTMLLTGASLVPVIRKRLGRASKKS